MRNLLKRLRRNTRGVMAVEFALILPVMLIMIAGVIEATNILMAQKKLVGAAQTAADLISQEVDVTSADVSDILTAASLTIRPFPTANLSIGVASVRYDDVSGNPAVDWTQNLNGGSVTDPTTLAAGLGTAGNSVIIVTATFNYTSVMGGLIILGSLSLSEVAISRPRTVPYVNLV